MTARQYGAALAWAESVLAGAGIDNARGDARLLLAAAAECSVETVFGYPERELAPAAHARLDDYVRRRTSGEPVSRILGWREFWGLRFTISAATLDPRPDSEVLVAAALAAFPDRNRALRVLDLGTGSGCLLLALLSERPYAEGVGIDLSIAACLTARGNARALGLERRARFLCGDWAASVAAGFDIILCNPPYIEDAAIVSLAPEVAIFDPRTALAGGADGLAAYRRLAGEIAQRLAPDGMAFIEMGEGQADAISNILSGHADAVETLTDLAGIQRCLVLRHRKKLLDLT